MSPRVRVDLSYVTDLPLFSTSQAHSWGLSDTDLVTLQRNRTILRLDRGWFTGRVAAPAEERHLLRTAAAVRMHGAGVAATGISALIVHGLATARADLETVEIVRAGPAHGRRRKGVRESLDPDLVTEQVEVRVIGASLPAVPPATAIVSTALSNNPVAAVVAGDEALRTRRCTGADIDHALARAVGRRGIARARSALGQLDARHESPGETLTAWELRPFGWRLVPQVRVVVHGRAYRLDFAVDGLMLAIEFDGALKYTGPEVMEAQERREEDLRSVGWVLVRFGWDDLADPAGMHLRISRAAAQAPRISDVG